MVPEKRQDLVRKAQALIDRDNAFFNIYFKAYFQAYNSDRIDGAIPVMGSGIGFPYIPLTYLYGKPKTARKEITAVNIHDIISLNPFYIPDVENEWWLRLVYDPLVRRDKDLKLIPWAARAWKLIDSTTIDITLRDGMKFHDGRPVTAEDLRFTIDYIKEWKFPVLSRIWKNIDSVKAVDGRTVRLKLTEPYAPFFETVFAYMFIAPKHIWENIPKSVDVKSPVDWPNPNPVGSGSYKFDTWKKGEYFHLTAHKEHFSPPGFEGLYYRVTPTTEGMMAMMEKGEADITAWNLDSEQAKRLASFPHLKTIDTPSIAMTEIRPHFKKKPTDDPAFRQALQHAINRKLMLDITFGGNGTLGYNTPIIPSIQYWNNPGIKVPEFSIDKAKDLLKKAGYTWDSQGRLCYPKGR
jgi:peptide/nickel transport system substrate-binding protein